MLPQQYWLHKYILHCEYLCYKSARKESSLDDDFSADYIHQSYAQLQMKVEVKDLNTPAQTTMLSGSSLARTSVLTDMMQYEVRPRPYSESNAIKPADADRAVSDIRQTKSDNHLHAVASPSASGSNDSFTTVLTVTDDGHLPQHLSASATTSCTSALADDTVEELRRRSWYEMFPENVINVSMMYDHDECVTIHDDGESCASPRSSTHRSCSLRRRRRREAARPGHPRPHSRAIPRRAHAQRDEVDADGVAQRGGRRRRLSDARVSSRR